MDAYQGQFPVISLGFKDVKDSSGEEIEAGVKKQVINLYIKHRYLKQYIQDEGSVLEDGQKEQLNHYFKGKLSQEDLKDSLRFLSELLYQHFGQPIAELFYSGFMLGLLSILSSAYVIESERESGLGRPGAVLIPKAGQGNQALIIEYKVSVDGLSATVLPRGC